MSSHWRLINDIFHKSMKCRDCFSNGISQTAFIDVAQPRWIGPDYFDSTAKVLIITLNPGAGNTSAKQRSNIPFRQMLHDYRDGKRTLQDLFELQGQYIPQWGTPPGRFFQFYMDGMGLTLDEVALVNVAWCADAKNNWPSSMLSQCFHLHTGKLIAALHPNVAILSGSATHKYSSEIKRLAPKCKVLCTLHYAHRKGRKAEGAELQRVKNEIASSKSFKPILAIDKDL